MNRILKTAFLAAAGTAFAAQLANANTLFVNQDLILGVRATGGTGFGTDYEVDLGSASLYNSGGAFTISSLLGADLSTKFGVDWNTRNDLLWSVSGVVFNTAQGSQVNNTMFVTAPRTDLSLQSTPWINPSSDAAQAPAGKINSLDKSTLINNTGFNNSPANGATTPNSTFKPTTGANSYTSAMTATAGTSFGFFNPTIENTLNTAGGPVRSDLYAVIPDGSGSPATLLGYFDFNSAGTLAFTAVPEPGAGSLFASAGILVLCFSHYVRRKQA